MIWLDWFRYWYWVLNPFRRTISEETLEYFAQDDAIDIKSFSGLEERSPGWLVYRRMFIKRRNWYVRHGLFSYAENIDDALGRI